MTDKTAVCDRQPLLRRFPGMLLVLFREFNQFETAGLTLRPLWATVLNGNSMTIQAFVSDRVWSVI